MSFCSKCGVQNETNAVICPNCSGNLFLQNQPRTSEFSKTIDDGARSPESNLSGESTYQGYGHQVCQPVNNEDGIYSRMDSQLGKGTIKPNAVEWSSDGYHFKYDEPARSLSKVEPIKEKTVEFRVTESEMYPPSEPVSSLKDAKDRDDSKGETGNRGGESEIQIPLSIPLSEPLLKPFSNPLQEPELFPERRDGLLDTSNIGTTDFREETFVESFPEDLAEKMVAVENMAPQEVTPSNEKSPGREDQKPGDLAEETEPVLRIVWEGMGCFIGIPFGPRYQVTNQTIRVQKDGKTAEYCLKQLVKLKVKQNWLGRLFGWGDLVATLREEESETILTLKAIADPAKVLKLIADLTGSDYNIKYG